MPSPIRLIINPSAGQTGQDRERIVQLFRSAGVEPEIRVARTGSEIGRLALEAANYKNSVVVAAGGDGTINAVASELVNTDKTLGVLPLGTLNHFAKDLRIPLDVNAAVQTILDGHMVNIDVAEVNGRFFFNNSGLGIYPRIVEAREQQREKGRNKWVALFIAAASLFERYPVLSVKLKTDNWTLSRRTPFLFVGNNEYELQGLDMGRRKCMNNGVLQVTVARHKGTLGLVRVFFSALLRKLENVKEVETFCVTELQVNTRQRRLTVALDGELTVIEAPLHYRINPAVLRVLVPKEKI